MKDPFVIFDRDGTLIEHVHHLSNPDLVVFKDDLVEALSKLQDFGFKLGIVTNQSIISRGSATVEMVNQVNSKILSFLKLNGVEIKFILICPHKPEDECFCRKPKPILGHYAEEFLNVPLKSSYVVGDQESDVEFGLNLQCKAVQVQGGAPVSLLANHVSSTLVEAAEWIILDFQKD
jgi:D-glycero-D-manno-heptose 1,7-bisphosphate phosphatase